MPEDSGEFSAIPKVVKPKAKYKEKEPDEQEEDEIKLIYNNLMWDKRVFRGNTYSALVTSKNVEMPYSNTSKKPLNIIQKQESEDMEEIGNRRANIQIFTDEFVETLTDKPPKYEYGSQTEFVIEKQIVRHQMLSKTGNDMQTQIWDNQLFDFDYEVEPLLTVLCARTLEISRMQVLQEEQLSIMKNRQKELLLEEDQERKKIKQMYDKEQQLERQNAKKLQNYRNQRQKKSKIHQKLFTRVVGKKYLIDIKQNTLNFVEGQGFFRNPIDEDLIVKIIPQFYSQSCQQEVIVGEWKRQALEMINAAKKLVIDQNQKAKEKERERRRKIIEKRKEQEREKNQRKFMRNEEKYMRNFLVEEKIEMERLEEERRKAEEEAENGEQEPA